MKVVFMGGSQPRHLYVANKLYEAGYLVGLVIEDRGQMMHYPPAHLKEIDQQNFIRHFADREAAEQKFFGYVDGEILKTKVPLLMVTQETLNDKATLDFLLELNPDLIVSYGIHKVENYILERFPDKAFNVHGGLSPWYKGNTTHFWPFYFLRPNWVGMTLHYLSERLDAGDIIHHSVPKLAYGDGIHDVACKAVEQLGIDLCQIIAKIEKGEEIPRVNQKKNGKLFVGTDWTPQQLRLIYNTFNNDIVDKYLDGELDAPEPQLVNALK